MKLELQCITNIEDMHARQGEWDRLLVDMGDHSCFHHYEWFEAALSWRRVDGWTPRILYFYHSGRLVGIIPLILGTSIYRSLPLKSLEFLTTPDTQFCSVLCHRKWLPAVCDAFATWLISGKQDWTVLNLSYIPDNPFIWSPMLTALRNKGLQVTDSTFDGNPYIDLRKTWNEYYSSRSRRLKKGNNLVANRLKKQGDLDIRWLRSRLDETTLENALDTLIRLSASSWKRNTGTSLDQPGPQAFIRTLTRNANKRCWLSLWLLYLDGRAIAMEYQLIHDRKVYALRADFDEAYSHLSPGTYLNWQLLKNLFDDGFDRYYMGPGHNSYKLRWMEGVQDLRRLTAYNKTLKGRLSALFFMHLLPMARTLKSKTNSVSLKKDTS